MLSHVVLILPPGSDWKIERMLAAERNEMLRGTLQTHHGYDPLVSVIGHRRDNVNALAGRGVARVAPAWEVDPQLFVRAGGS